MREATQEKICAYCKQLITEQVYKGLPSGEKAHVSCYLDHTDQEEDEPGR